MKLRRILPFLFAVFFAPLLIQAQVTTSSITGFVRSDKGEPLDGATVTAVHQPSGTKYATLTNKEGHFTLPNTRIGGPYQITIEYVGFATQNIDDITLALGEPYLADVKLSQKTDVLTEITIAGNKVPSVIKTGASTVFSGKQLSSLPSLSRSITDYTRLTPQASAGNSFNGTDGRYNNLQIDGANLNNNFGLSTDPLPGGGASPISVDAFDEISVNIAPFDVRQSGFTGAGLNVTTKSGTNTFHGTAYSYYRNQSFNGTHVGDVVLTQTPQTNKVYGASLGGPIIKNKLFFFVNAEYDNASIPSEDTYVPTGSTAGGLVSASPKDSLDKFKSILQSKYNYNPGVYDNRPNYVTQNTKLLGKLDWNISNKHKLVLKFSNFKGSEDDPLNGGSVPNSGVGGFTITNPTDGVVDTKNNARLPNSRNSAQSIGFSNSDYGINHVVQSGTLELNSNFSSRVSNQLLLAYTHINDTRFSQGGLFPTIEIFNGDSTVPGVTGGRNYMSAGTDPFTRNNEVINNVADFTDNVSYFAGKHTITGGASYEYQKVGNAFMPGSEGYYMYNSLNDFVNNATPAYFSYTYSLIPGQPKDFSANMKVGQLGVYLQDEYNANPNFKLTYGIRGDVPTYLQAPVANPAISALQFPNKDGVMTNYSTGKWPNAALLISPRVGYRWKVPDEKGLILRGGTGIFTGKVPFVFLTNMPSGSGVYQNGVVLNTPAQLAGITFNPNPDAYIGKFPSTVSTTAPGSFVLIDPNFKFPQVFRTNFGVDKQLGNGFVASADIIYSKDINAVKMRNANLIAPTGTLTGEDNREYYPSSQTGAAKFVDPSVGSVIVLENTKQGYSFSSTVQIAKSFTKGFFGSLAYTYTLATEISPNPGSQATSAWQSIINKGTPNDDELYNSAYFVPHRIVANLSYRFEYADHFASTFSLFYQGSSQGSYSYIVGGDLIGDGNSTSDLMYIYSTGADVPFVNVLNKNGTIQYSIAQQEAAYDQLVANTPYLRNHVGQYAQRNAALLPWYNDIDARFLQDFYIRTGSTKHTLEFSVDIINLPNLLNKFWGITDLYTLNNPLTLKSTAGGTPTYNLAETTTGALITNPFENNNASTAVSGTTSTWGMQLGLRYIF